MPYALVAVVAVIYLTIRYILVSDASDRSKWIVGCLGLISLAVWWRFPRWNVLATILQVGVCVYILIYIKVELQETKRSQRKSD